MKIKADTGKVVEVEGAKALPCAQCPWRRSNWGRTDAEHPEFNTPERREEMWSEHPSRPAGTGVRHGNRMLCHRGWDGPSTVAHECSGAVVLAQRELLRFHAAGFDALAPSNPNGLTVHGATEIARELCGPHMTLGQLRVTHRARLLELCHRSLSDSEVGHHQLDPPKPGEFEE